MQITEKTTLTIAIISYSNRDRKSLLVDTFGMGKELGLPVDVNTFKEMAK